MVDDAAMRADRTIRPPQAFKEGPRRIVIAKMFL
jgi:hypothetical protein